MDNNLTVITIYNLLAFIRNGLVDDDITDELGIVISSIDKIKKIINTFPEPKTLNHSLLNKIKKTINELEIFTQNY